MNNLPASARRKSAPKLALIVATITLLTSAAPATTAQQTHRLEAGRDTVAYGYYWSEAPPVLRIASGDIIDVDTMLTSNPERLIDLGVPPDQVQQSLRDIQEIPREERGPGGHILTGPVYVEGAEPGDVLQVDILEVDLNIPYGYNGCSGFTPENCDEGGFVANSRLFWFDLDSMTTEFADGITIPLRPFFGSMGVSPPPDAGRWSSVPPWIHGGNIDNKEFVAGTTLYLPVWVEGALFEVGDGHAAQGDGEVDQTAIETSLRGRLRLTVRKDMSLEWPVAETPTHWITMGTDEDLTEATRIAINQTIDFLGERFGLPRMEAYRLISLALDLRITQLVDQKKGVHVMIPKSLFGEGG